MATDPSRNLESILAALAAQKPATATPPHGQPLAQPPYQQQPLPNYPPPSYPPPAAYPSYPQPSASGSLDLSSIQPSSSGNVSIQEAIARAKAQATQSGVTPYDRPVNYSNHSRPGDSGRYRSSRSRSRSPPRRDAFRDNYNPYRDERRDDRAPPGRDYGRDHGGRDRDRSFSPRRGRTGTFSPRGANGPGRGGRSPGRGGQDDNMEIIEIEASLVGLIIGRQGENLRRVETDTQCRVQFISAATPDEKFRQCKITGPPARRAEAKAAINRIIEDSGMGAIARAGLGPGHGGDRGGGGRGFAPPPSSTVNLKENEDCTQIMVPDRTVGLIIGRGGETIRDLQEKSGCHVNIVGESKSVNGLRPVNLIGPRHASALAKELIMEIVDSDTRNAAGGGGGGGGGGGHSRPHRDDRGGGGFGGGGGGGGHDKINDSIYVPSEAVGMIIGKGGETIREMQNQTGCKINVSQSSGPGEVEREIGLIGSRDSIEQAKRAIEDKVDAVRQKGSGGGYGGRGGGRGGGRERDNPNYIPQASNSGGGTSSSSAQGGGGLPGLQAPAGDAGAVDPYAAYGGYNNYVALWYQAVAQQGGSADGKPPGTS